MRFEKVPSKKAAKGYTYKLVIPYKDEYGKQRKYTKSGFTTLAEAKKHGLQMEPLLISTGHAPVNKTLKDAWTEWLDLNEAHRAPGTITTYKKAYEAHLKLLEDMQLSSFTIGFLQRFFDGKKDLSKNRLISIKNVLSSCFKIARKQGWMTNNPLPDIELHGIEKEHQKETLTLSEVEQIVDQAEQMFKPDLSKELTLFMYIGYYTGLRAGEILALTWSDFDLDSHTLTVSKKIELKDGKAYVTERMKTKTSRAILPVPADLETIIKPYADQADPEDQIFSFSYAYIFKTVKKAAVAVDIDFHPHMLRHTFVTNLVRSGVDPKTAAQAARHSNIATTLDIYTTMNDADLRRAIDQAFQNRPNSALN